MEGIIVIAVLYFIFRAFSRKNAEGSQGNEQTQSRPRSTATMDAFGSPFKVQREVKPVRKITAMPKNAQSTMSAWEGVEKYKPIQPTIIASRVIHRDYQYGSMGGASNEGTASNEGRPVNESTLTFDQTNALPFFVDVLDESPSQVLPANWTKDELVQAVVMTEILNKPRVWREHDGRFTSTNRG